MFHATRSTTSPGRTALVLLSLISLVLSFFAIAAPVIAVDPPVVYATVTDHEAHSDERNAASYWGANCTKMETGFSGQTYLLPVLPAGSTYDQVIVKAGSDTYANTIFDNPLGGTYVFADTNGNFQFDPVKIKDVVDADKDISHIIICKTVVVQTPDVTVAKDTSVATVAANGTFNYVFVVTTSGTGDSVNVTLTDPLPNAFTYGTPVITSPDANDTCSILAESGGSGTLSCSFGTEPSGTSITVTLQATTDAADCGDPILNTATVNATVNTNANNNTDGASITVTCAPDVTVAKDTSADPVSAGSNFNYVFQVTTGGTGSSANVQLNDPLPDDFTYGTPVITGGDAGDTCSTSGGTLSCQFGTVASGTTITVTLQATTDAADCGPAITNTATVSSTVNTNANNNTANADVTVTCGSITIIKNAVPDAAQDFRYTTTGPTEAGLGIFDLDDDADGTLPNSRTFSELAAGSYTVTEVPAGGWTVTSINCSAGGSADATNNRQANITLVAGANVTCTFVNTQDVVVPPLTGSITILKNALPDDAQDFVFTATGTGLSGFTLDDDTDATRSNQQTFTGLTAGSYSVTETATTGWGLTSVTCSAGGTVNGSTANIVLVAGANVTCTFVNTRQQSGTLSSNPTPAPTPVVRTGTATSTGVPNTGTSADAGLTAAAMLGALMLLSAGVFVSATIGSGRRRR